MRDEVWQTGKAAELGLYTYQQLARTAKSHEEFTFSVAGTITREEAQFILSVLNLTGGTWPYSSPSSESSEAPTRPSEPLSGS